MTQFFRWMTIVGLSMAVWPVPAGVLVLKNGKRLVFDGDYQVSKDKVLFKDKQGELFQIPLALVDLERSKEEAERLQRKAEKAKQDATKATAFNPELYATAQSAERPDKGVTLSDRDVATYVSSRPIMSRHEPGIPDLVRPKPVPVRPPMIEGFGLQRVQGRWVVDIGMTEGEVRKRAQYKGQALDRYHEEWRSFVLEVTDRQLVLVRGARKTRYTYTLKHETTNVAVLVVEGPRGQATVTLEIIDDRWLQMKSLGSDDQDNLIWRLP